MQLVCVFVLLFGHKQVAFKDGIIVHENASGQTQSATTATNSDSKNDGKYLRLL
jgi:hypothetical protein